MNQHPKAEAMFLSLLGSKTSELKVKTNIRIQLQRSGILPLPGDTKFRYTWSNWNISRNNLVDGKSITRIVFEWLEKRDKLNPGGLWLHGPTGVGKDHLANVAAMMLAVRNEWRSRRLEWVHYLNQLRESYGGGPPAHLTKYAEADVLIVSDIDRARTTSFVLEQMGQLVRSRKGKTTLYTANLSLEQFCSKLSRSTKRGDDPTEVSQTAATIESRLYEEVDARLLCTSKHGDWRKTCQTN